jgi:hypothetical protein
MGGAAGDGGDIREHCDCGMVRKAVGEDVMAGASAGMIDRFRIALRSMRATVGRVSVGPDRPIRH